jgi:hypothetical protein
MSTPPPPPPPPEDQGYEEPQYYEATRAHEDRPKTGYWHRLGGGSLSISIIVHALFLILALFIIWRTSNNVEEPPDFLPGGGGGGGGGEKHAAQKKMRAVSHAQPKMKLASAKSSGVTLPDVQSSMTDFSGLTQMTIGGGGLGTGQGIGRGTGSGSGVGSGIGSGWGPGSGAGFISLPKIMQSRCSPAERAQKMRENGGNEQCEAAVKKGLKWLKEKQNPDGSWGNNDRAGMTGLALLAYLGHCETPESPVYGETVLKGITFLIELGQKNGNQFNGIFSQTPSAIRSTYEHGIATYALGEVYSFAKLGKRELPGLRQGFERGVQIIIEKQTKDGSWGYKDGIGYDPYGRNDLSVTGWQFQALKAAKHTNLKIPGLAGAMKKVEKYLESTQTADGGFGNADRAQHYNQWNLSGAALLGLQTMGAGNAGKVNKGIRWLVDQFEKEPLSWNSDCYLYTWYYNTQALFQKGGEPWKKWNEQFQKEILANQLEDGSYKVEGGGEVAAATTTAAGGSADVYRTVLCTLMLEVYYRYLKVGDRESSMGESNLMPLK